VLVVVRIIAFGLSERKYLVGPLLPLPTCKIGSRDVLSDSFRSLLGYDTGSVAVG